MILKNGSYRGQAGSQIERRTHQVLEGLECVHMETCRHGRCTSPPDRAFLERLEDRQAHQTEAMTVRL